MAESIVNSLNMGELFLLFLLSFFSIVIVGKWRLFHLPLEEKIPIRFLHVFVSFALYLGTLLFVYNFVMEGLKHLLTGISKEWSGKEYILTGWTQFLTLLIATFLLLYFCLFKERKLFLKLWKPSLFKDLAIGILSWLFIFPIILFVERILDTLTILFFHVEKLPEQMAITYLKTTLAHPLFFAFALIAILLIAPLIEELLFRGFLQSWLKNHLSRALAILLTSLAFSLFHFSYSQGVANIPLIGSLFILSCFLGVLFERQQSLASPIALHATFNALSVVQFLNTP